MQLNTHEKTPKPKTHEGGPGERTNPLEGLRRTVMSCLLWEDTFYEDGVAVADRIASLAEKVSVEDLCQLAVETRKKGKLRHVPLLLVRLAAKKNSEAKTSRSRSKDVEEALFQVIERVDQIPEFLAMYWKDGKQPIAHAVKRGLARAFQKFDEYQLAKYDRDTPIKLRDVLFEIHAKPKLDGPGHYETVEAIAKKNYRRGAVKRHTNGQGELWTRLVEKRLETPDTWEVQLSAAGKTGERSKGEIFEDLMKRKKLGALALLRNLRKMVESDVSDSLIREALTSAKADRILPYQFITAAKYAPRFERELETMMLRNLESMDPLPGRTLLLIDVSGSMEAQLSGKSELRRVDAASGLAMMASGISEPDVFTFNTSVRQIPSRRGFALKDEISRQVGGGTQLGSALLTIARTMKEGYHRVIVITDEQSADRITEVPKCEFFYMLNVGTYETGCNTNSIRYGETSGGIKAVRVHGFSEHTLTFVGEYERTASGNDVTRAEGFDA